MTRYSELTSQRLALRAAGFAPIPLNGKVPKLSGWQTLLDVSAAEIEGWEMARPGESNTGVLTAHMPTFDVDVLDRDAAVAIERLVHRRLGGRGVVLMRIGRPPKRAFPFRTDTPFNKIVANLVAADGSSGQKLEFLGDGQQVVVFGRHPDTGRPYRWHGNGDLFEPGEVPYANLPFIDEAEARQLVDDAVELLVARYGYSRAAMARGGTTASASIGARP